MSLIGFMLRLKVPVSYPVSYPVSWSVSGSRFHTRFHTRLKPTPGFIPPKKLSAISIIMYNSRGRCGDSPSRANCTSIYIYMCEALPPTLRKKICYTDRLIYKFCYMDILRCGDSTQGLITKVQNLSAVTLARVTASQRSLRECEDDEEDAYCACAD